MNQWGSSMHISKPGGNMVMSSNRWVGLARAPDRLAMTTTNDNYISATPLDCQMTLEPKQLITDQNDKWQGRHCSSLTLLLNNYIAHPCLIKLFISQLPTSHQSTPKRHRNNHGWLTLTHSTRKHQIRTEPQLTHWDWNHNSLNPLLLHCWYKSTNTTNTDSFKTCLTLSHWDPNIESKQLQERLQWQANDMWQMTCDKWKLTI